MLKLPIFNENVRSLEVASKLKTTRNHWPSHGKFSESGNFAEKYSDQMRFRANAALAVVQLLANSFGVCCPSNGYLPLEITLQL